MENPRDTNPPPTPSTPSRSIFSQQTTPTTPTTPITPTTPTANHPPTAAPNISPAFAQKLAHLRLPLAPLVQLTSGQIHPRFPSTLLHFWLLTDGELESLASFYHQRSPSPWTDRYPCPVPWPRSGLGIEDKRRKMGRFIGLRGCESPVNSNVGGYWVSERDLEEAARRDREGGKGF
ncbi:hypothetical protein QBC39DRAFT_383669 [Podospora conica]|nr:hypothetical protein QBC39DRAFT_383669 [Schizothecium conicum]